MKHEVRRTPIAAEIKALEDQGTREVQPLPLDKKSLGSKWVFKKKYDESEKLQQLKAKIVIFGHH